MSVQERSETKSGAKMEPTWHQNGSQNRSKIDPKLWWIFQIDFEAVLEPPTPGQPPTAERAGAVEGGRGEA